MQARNVAHQIVEALARNAACGFLVDAVELCHDVGVVGDLKIHDRLFAELLYLDIFAVVLTDRHAVVDDVRDLHHDLFEACFDLGLLGLKRGKLLCLLADELLLFLCLVAQTLAHQHTDLLGDLVAVGAQLVCAGICRTLAGVQLDRFIYQRQLCILEFLANIFFHKFGIVTNKFNIQHISDPFGELQFITLYYLAKSSPCQAFAGFLEKYLRLYNAALTFFSAAALSGIMYSATMLP